MKWLESNILRAANAAKKKIIIWPEGTSIMSVVARNGNLEMIQWLKEMKCPKDRNTFSEAARGCHVEVLDWLQNMYGWPDASWPDAFSTCEAIASTGRLDILQWALDHGCPWDARCASTCASEGHMEMFRWIMDLNREFFPIDMDSLCSNAASGGHLQLLQLMIKWARINGCRWDANTCTAAARLGKLEILQWLREENCPWDAKTCAVAAERAHLHVLEWARSRECPCPWDESTCSAAAKAIREGDLVNYKKWKSGCPMNRSGCLKAANSNRWKRLMKWVACEELVPANSD
eukprot:gene18355-25856_t